MREKKKKDLVTQHMQRFLCKLSNPGELTAAGQRSTSLFDHVCPPLAYWMPFITQQSLNHRCAFEREKKTFAAGLAALGGAVAKGKVLLCDG